MKCTKVGAVLRRDPVSFRTCTDSFRLFFGENDEPNKVLETFKGHKGPLKVPQRSFEGPSKAPRMSLKGP